MSSAQQLITGRSLADLLPVVVPWACLQPYHPHLPVGMEKRTSCRWTQQVWAEFLLQI